MKRFLVMLSVSLITVAAWAQRFLFNPEQLDLELSALSGGEQARVRIAQLMLKPADVLFLDEPTNDLDIPALEVLEAPNPWRMTQVSSRDPLGPWPRPEQPKDGRGGREPRRTPVR